MMIAQAAAQDLWSRYQQTRDAETRLDLFEQYRNFVYYVLKHLDAAPPAVLDRDDLVSEGMIGLLQAIDRYNPDTGVAFPNFAIPRVRGCIIDALRRSSVVPRGTLRRARLIESTALHLERERNRQPTEEEVRLATGLDIRAFEQTKRQARVGVESLDRAADLNPRIIDRWSADPAAPTPFPTPEAALDRSAEHQALTEAIASLPDRHRLVIALYYQEELTMRDIGEVLGITESRVSQIHSRVVRRLRELVTQADQLRPHCPDRRPRALTAALAS